jgi:hypothetical protein
MAAEQIGTGNPDGYYFVGDEKREITFNDSTTGGTGLIVKGSNTTGVSVEGTQTTGLAIAGTTTTGIAITVAVTDGLSITGAATNGIKMTGTSGTGIYINKTASTAGTLKLHCHAMAASTDDSPNQYANEFKGEFLATSGTTDGIASHYHMSASGTAILRSVLGVAYLDSGKTLSGTNFSTGSWLCGGLFAAAPSGVVNGTGACIVGVYGEPGSCSGATLTAAKYLTSIWGNSSRVTALSSGISSLCLLTNQTGAAALTAGIYMINDSANKITSALYTGAGITNLLDVSGAGNADFLTTGGTDCTASGATDPAYTIAIKTPAGTGYIRVWAAA